MTSRFVAVPIFATSMIAAIVLWPGCKGTETSESASGAAVVEGSAGADPEGGRGSTESARTNDAAPTAQGAGDPPATPLAGAVEDAKPLAAAGELREPKEPAGETPLDVVKSESIGSLRYGLTEKQVREAIGAPESKSRPEFDEASGDSFVVWRYPKRGLELGFRSGTKPHSLAWVAATSPCDLATRRGIRVGAALNQLEEVYPRNDEESSDTHFVFGSLYGGLLFEIVDGKVDRIFLGASAE